MRTKITLTLIVLGIFMISWAAGFMGNYNAGLTVTSEIIMILGSVLGGVGLVVLATE